jgi:cell division septation protein DedD
LTKSPDTEPATEEARREAKEPERRAKAEVKEKKLQTKEQTAAKIAEEKSEKIVPPAAPPEATERGENGKNWTVQVNAFPDPKSAKIWVDRLKNKGYNAYSTEVLNQGKTWYRVRVGRYASQQEAEKIEETLRVKENITKAFVTNR